MHAVSTRMSRVVAVPMVAQPQRARAWGVEPQPAELKPALAKPAEVMYARAKHALLMVVALSPAPATRVWVMSASLRLPEVMPALENLPSAMFVERISGQATRVSLKPT
jgi:hypothetical protein